MNHSNDMTRTDQPTDKLHDHHRQQLSAMLDGELLPDQARFMLRRLEHDSELAACWERWQVCGDILRGRHEALLPADFSRRVADAIAGQGQVAAASTDEASARRPRWARWGGGAALAASVAMAALFVGRQVPEPESEPAREQMQVVASTAAPDAMASTPAVPAPAAPVESPDTASTLAAAAVAVAEVPRRAAERRSSNAQQQRAAARNRRAAEAPVRVAATAGTRGPAGPANPDPVAGAAAPAASTVLVADTGVASAGAADANAAELFTVEPVHPRPWPRAILPGLPAQDAFTASYGGVAPERHPFHPFEPRVELQLPAPGEQPQPGASGPR